MNLWSVGGIVAGLVSILFVFALLGSHGWRLALLLGAGSALYALYARRLVPESRMTVGSGDPLPELALSDTVGRTVPLASLRGEETLIVFLRHLA